MLISLATLILLACSDLKFHLIPKRLNFVALAAAICVAGLTGVLWAIGILLIYLTLFKASRGSIGYGDVRLAPVAVISLPEANPAAVHLLAWLLAGAVIVSIVRSRNARLPFAPALLVSTIYLKFCY